MVVGRVVVVVVGVVVVVVVSVVAVTGSPVVLVASAPPQPAMRMKRTPMTMRLVALILGTLR